MVPMKNFDYTYCRKQSLEDLGSIKQEYDLFISCFNLSDRVSHVFNKINAKDKHWLLVREYQIPPEQHPTNSNQLTIASATDEGSIIRDFLDPILDEFKGDDLSKLSMCIDITGFIRPHLLFLIRYLHLKGVSNFDVIYAEPKAYEKQEHTKFSKGSLLDVKEIVGYDAPVKASAGSDSKKPISLLIMGSGYDSDMIAKVTDYKTDCEIIHLIGFPSLRADMFQENMLRVASLPDLEQTEYVYAPAYDPFVTAETLKATLHRKEKFYTVENLFLSPMSTKVQVLGFALYYIWERISTKTSMIFPPSEYYSEKTSIGIGRVWSYEVVLPRVGA